MCFLRRVERRGARRVVAVSPSSVYSVLAGAGLLDRWTKKPFKKGAGFVQPLRPHEHWLLSILRLAASRRSELRCPSVFSVSFGAIFRVGDEVIVRR